MLKNEIYELQSDLDVAEAALTDFNQSIHNLKKEIQDDKENSDFLEYLSNYNEKIETFLMELGELDSYLTIKREEPK